MENAVEYVCLAIDAVVLATVYKVYRASLKSLESVKNAPSFEISKDLESKVGSYADNVVPYAVVHGTVQSIGQPLISPKAPHFRGVIQESVIREHKMQWSWATRLWRETERDVSHTTNNVQFGLAGLTDETMVEVMEPLQGEGLQMLTVYDEFKPSRLGFWDSITTFFIGETTTKYQYIEKVLPEGTVLTGIGALVLKPCGVRLEPPGHGLKYYLTQMSEATLTRSLEAEVKTLRTLAFVFGAFGGIILTVLLVKYYQKCRERRLKAAELKRMRELMELRLRTRHTSQTEYAGDSELSPEQTCLICCTNPREVLILECGHLCCCADCSIALNPALCPVCRGAISRLVPAFVS